MTTRKVDKSEDEWRAELPANRYAVLRQSATEPPFSGALYKHEGDGTYRCAGCHAELFSSDTKFESGSGWPSFYDQMGTVVSKPDPDGMRTEVVCGSCDGHLGHVFNDGPNPTGLRYCINSLALEFNEK